jgi:sugar lactone lactonase YvrE
MAACGVAVVVLVFVGSTSTPALAQSSPPPPTGSTQSINTIAGTGVPGSSGNGLPAVQAQLHNPSGVAEDVVGDLYIADTRNSEVRKIVEPTAVSNDIISVLAGTGTPGFSGDHGPATQAMLRFPRGVAVDAMGDVFIADTGNNRIREVSTTGMITTFAGTGRCGPSGDEGHEQAFGRAGPIGDGGHAANALLCEPTGVAVDTSGNVYIADAGHHEVRIVSPQGIISAFAGTGRVGSSGDGGPAVKAELGYPVTVVVNSLKNVYIADSLENNVRQVNPAGTISTLIGRTSGDSKPGKSDYSASGAGSHKQGQFRLDDPSGLGVDQMGDVWVGDTGHNQILEVTATGTVTLYAGTGHPGFSGDGGSAVQARLFHPQGSFAWDSDALYFADTGNQRVRGIFNGPPPVLPEATSPLLLAAGAVVIVLGSAMIVRRRRRTAVG